MTAAVPTPRSTPDTDRGATTTDLLRQVDTSDDECRDELLQQVVVVNRGVAEAMARRYRGRGIDDDDLYQVAYEALVKAVRRFDPGHDKDLLSYAVPTIRGELQRHFRDLGWMIRPTRSVQETQWRAGQVEDSLSQELGRPATREEVADALGISLAEYDEAKSASGCFQPASLDRPVTDDSGTRLGDLLEDESDDTERAEARVMLAPVLRRLPERERRVLYLRFCEDLTQAEIGRELGVTQTQVSRILSSTLETLRVQLT